MEKLHNRLQKSKINYLKLKNIHDKDYLLQIIAHSLVLDLYVYNYSHACIIMLL